MNITFEMIENLNKNGFLILDKYFSNDDLDGFESAFNKALTKNNSKIYLDRLGKLRRLEQFTKHSTFFMNLDKKILSLLLGVTDEEYILFKDKINLKPPGGEGFYAHYDGVFKFDKFGKECNGWYEYADSFINVLVALDDFTIENGPLEVANVHLGGFEDMLANTKQDGSPDLRDEVALKCNFKPVIISRGGVVVFSNLCPHRSAPNISQKSRTSLYMTYHKTSFGDNYENYFLDKESSSNRFKSLLGDL